MHVSGIDGEFTRSNLQQPSQVPCPVLKLSVEIICRNYLLKLYVDNIWRNNLHKLLVETTYLYKFSLQIIWTNYLYKYFHKFSSEILFTNSLQIIWTKDVDKLSGNIISTIYLYNFFKCKLPVQNSINRLVSFKRSSVSASVYNLNYNVSSTSCHATIRQLLKVGFVSRGGGEG